MAAITVFVDGVDRSLLVDRGSRLSYSRDINGQGGARFVLADVPGGFVPDDGMEVLIKEDGVNRFGGIIDGRPRNFRGPDSANQLTFYKIDAASWEQRLNKRRVWRAYAETAFETIVADLNADFLDSEGITLSVLAGSALTITFNGETVAEALDNLCSLEADGRSWYITPAKVLTIDLQSATPAPATLDADNVNLNSPSPTVEPDRAGYANTITVVGGNPELPILYTARDTGEIAARAAVEGGSGIYHDVVEDNEVVTENQAQVKAEGILLQRKAVRQRFTCMTDVSGFEIAQEVTVNLPNLGVASATFFIIGIETAASPGVRELWHTITAVDGFLDGSWQSEYRRKIAPKTIPMQIEATPGLVRVDPKAGVLIHDPPGLPTGWFQGAPSGTLDFTPTGIGISTDSNWLWTIRRGGLANTGGCGGGLFPGALGSCHVNRQSVLEGYAITGNQPATTPTRGASWDELFAGATFKTGVVSSPNSRYVGVQHTATPGKFIVVDTLNGVLLGSVDTDISNQIIPGEPVWVGDHVYWPNVSDGKIYIYDVSVLTAPTEAAVFATSLTAVFCVIAAPGGTELFACGQTGVVGLDATSPAALVEDDAKATGDYVSVGLDERNFIAAAVRFDASNVRVLVLQTVGTALTVLHEANVALATSVMEGLSSIHRKGSFAVWSERDAVNANTLKAHVFDTVDAAAPTFIETLSYTHGAVGNIGPAKTVVTRKSAYTFLFNTDAQVTFSQEGFDKIVPYEIEIPLRVAFGGTGLREYTPGNLLAATAPTVLGLVNPPTDPAQRLIFNAGEPEKMKWSTPPSGSGGGALNVWLWEY